MHPGKTKKGSTEVRPLRLLARQRHRGRLAHRARPARRERRALLLRVLHTIGAEAPHRLLVGGSGVVVVAPRAGRPLSPARHAAR